MRASSRSLAPVRITTRLAEPSTVVAVPMDVVAFAYSHGVCELPSRKEPLDVVAAMGLAAGAAAAGATARGLGAGDPISQPLNETAAASTTKRGHLADMPPKVSSAGVTSPGGRGRRAHVVTQTVTQTVTCGFG